MTTPEQAPELLNTAGLFTLWQAYCEKKEQCEDLTEQLELVTKEREELQKQVDDFCMAYRIKTDAENKKLSQELDVIALSVDQWRVDYNELLLESYTMMSAAKLALDALDEASHFTSALPEYHQSDLVINEAIAAMRRAGVK